MALDRGYFATGSNSGTIKIWDPLLVSPIASISDENCEIDFLLTVKLKSDLCLVYVSVQEIKIFSFKSGHCILLLDTPQSTITAITLNDQNPAILNLGTDNGNVIVTT